VSETEEAQALRAQRIAKDGADGSQPGGALDFAHDVLAAGRTIRVLSELDAYTRECLALEVDTGSASRRVTRVIDEVIAQRGRPQAIRRDNGPELTSLHFLAWSVEWKIELRHIQSGKPTQNAHVESFHGRLRDECLWLNCFTNLFDARPQDHKLEEGRSTTKNGRTAALTIAPQPSSHIPAGCYDGPHPRVSRGVGPWRRTVKAPSAIEDALRLP
jgi:putative transposase